jgi:tRNA/tmRNA/rRNA uracil-C5-methylase (TrmA/RlmC/RlmD family)
MPCFADYLFARPAFDADVCQHLCEPWKMDFLDVELDAPAAGGGSVARSDGKVYFVRHGIPGERVRTTMTEDHGRWARADAIEILEPSFDRVEPPCPYAGPMGCGGCDYQHVSLDRQREMKAQLVMEQLQRIARIDVPIEVAGVGDATGLGSRTRVRYAIDAKARLSMRKYRSHETVEVDRCRLAVEEIQNADTSRTPLVPGNDLQVLFVPGQDPDEPILLEISGDEVQRIDAPSAPFDRLGVQVGGFSYVFSPTSFWQIHRRAPELLVDDVMARLDAQPGSRVLDLYCGVGLFTQPLAHRVGPSGSVTGVDVSESAIDDARQNLAGMPWVELHAALISPRTVRAISDGTTHVVIDPPRSGCAKGVLELLTQERTIEQIVMVSCDPSTFARDAKILMNAGWEYHDVRVFDLFEMTEHVELVASFTR